MMFYMIVVLQQVEEDGFSIVRNNDQLRTYTSGAYQITPSTFQGRN